MVKAPASSHRLQEHFFVSHRRNDQLNALRLINPPTHCVKDDSGPAVNDGRYTWLGGYSRPGADAILPPVTPDG
jgi:hypothetical protein